MISNMQFGHMKTLTEFGYIPRIGWQIDVFGLSATNARLMSEMGIKAVFGNRIDVADRQLRRNQKSLEFVWRPYFEYSGKEA